MTEILQTNPLNPGSKKYIELKEAFDFFDKDHSNSIDISEIQQALSSIGRNPSEEEVKDIMSSCDKNSDNIISFEEFVYLIGDKSKFNVNQSVEDEMKEQFRAFD